MRRSAGARRGRAGLAAARAPARFFVALAALVYPGRAGAEYRAAFPYRDAEFLMAGESNGGIVVVPDSVDPSPGATAGGPRDRKTPLVVLLHGVNLDQVLHMWFGTRAYPDLAAIAARTFASGASPPYLLAAPSQTRGAASGRRMWQDFDLDDFVRAVEGSLQGHAVVDRDAVFVIGHSGAACNPDGGLLRVARATSLVVPRAILSIDTCLDEDSGAALGAAPESAKIWVRYQPLIWPRPLDRFRATFAASAELSGHAEPFIQVVSGLPEPVHVQILLDTFATFLPAVLSGRDVGPPAAKP